MFKSIVTTATFQQSGITFTGTILNGFLGALFYIIVARVLGPSEFGLLTVAIVILTLIADIADIGTNTGLIRFVSSNLSHNKEKALRFLKLSLEVKLIVWIISFLIFFFLSPLIADQIFHKKELIIPLKLVSFGIGGALLFSFTTSTLQAFQKYFVWSSINILTNASRLLLILILGFFIRFNANSAMIVYIILPFFGFFLALLILPTRKILTSQNELSLSKEFFSYNIPVAVFTLIAAFSARLDTFLNATLLSSREVGIYGAANQLIQIVPQLVSALGIVAAPKFASFVSNKDMLVYLKKFQILVSGICVLGLLTIPITVYLIPLIFGQAYQEAITPFIFLFIAMLVFLISVPVQNAVIFYFGRPDIFIWVSLGHLLIIGGLGYYLISNYGILGTSVTVLIGMLFNFIAPSIWLINKIVTNGKRLEKGSL